MGDVKIGRRIATLRGSLTQREVARRSGLDPGTISRIERGEIDPTYSTLAAIASALNVGQPDFVAGGRQGVVIAYPRETIDTGQQVEAALSALRRTNLEIIAALSSTLESALLLASNPALARDGFQRAQERLQGLGGE